MLISKIELSQQARKTLFHPDILEKVWHLMTLLEVINKDPYLETRLALKGGTALNLFLFHVPRLSVDIDLNYIGSPDREVMEQEKPVIESLLKSIFLQQGFTIIRTPNRYAGGKWQLRYQSVLGNQGNLEVDINFMFRVPLWDTCRVTSRSIGDRVVSNVKLMSTPEIIGGKLTALLARTAARDLFDVYHLFSTFEMEKDKIRLASILYGTSSTVDWRKIDLDSLSCDLDEIQRFLIPLLKKDQSSKHVWIRKTDSLLETCKEGILRYLLPLTEKEIIFLDHFYEKRAIEPSLLTNDQSMIDKIHLLPGLKWKLKTLAMT